MICSRISALGALLVVSAGSCVTLAGVPDSWTFELQCRSSLDPGIAPFNMPYPSSLSSQYVSLGEDGSVAIRVFLGTPSASEGIFYGRDGVGSVILTGLSSEDLVWTSSVSNHNGRVSVDSADFIGGASVYDTAGNLLQAFPAGGTEGTSGFSSPSINAGGAMVYRADFGFIGDKIVIDEFDGGVRTQTLIADDYTGPYSFLFAPRINDQRQVLANTIPVSGASRRIVRFEPDGSATTVAETGGTWNSFVNSTALASGGDAAFSARRAIDSVWEVNRWDGDGYTAIATGADPDINNSSLANFPPAISGNGWVALRATDAAQNSTALWVGDGENLVKLLEYGQMIDTDLGPIELGFDFGAGTGRQVMNGVIDINDAGQVGFAAFLRNGTIGVFVATPTMGSCLADYNGDGEVNFFDVSDFLSGFAAGDPDADITGDGEFNFFDVSAYIQALGAGCP